MNLNSEDYLRGVYYLSGGKSPVRPIDLAKRLSVSKNTISAMVEKLAGKKLLSHEKYGGISLTPAGAKIAKGLTHKHRLIELFLVRKLGRNASKVHNEACRLEHDFSNESIGAIKRLLGNPKTDPHGMPIYP